MKTLNINSIVRIKLTSCGIAKLRAKHEELCSLNPYLGNFIPPKTDKDGYCEMQLWKIMNTFGEDLSAANMNLPFELKIQIDDAQFEES